MNEASTALDNLPQPPLVIAQFLQKLGVTFNVRRKLNNLPAAQCVQAVMLEDAVGPLLVLFSQDQLLDLSRLADLTGRKLVTVTAERQQRMLSKHGLSELPALPPLLNSPCLYDDRLLKAPSVFIESGQSGVLLEIARADLQVLLSKSSAALLGEPLKNIKLNLDRPDDDRSEITQAVQAFTARRIQQRLEETIEIPPLPESAQKIIKLRVDPNATIDDITGVVETDPALAAQVISWAASPYYAAPSKIRSVEDAIVRVLGFDLVINLALGLALGKTLSPPKDQPQQSTPYWHQAIYTAAVIEGLTRSMPRAERPESGLTYLAGLLHNFGYLVLAHVFPPHLSLICRHIEVNPHLTHNYVEHHLLGISSDQIGAWLMRSWDMPEELANALRFQNDPDYNEANAAYPRLVNLAVHLLRNRGIGSGPCSEIPQSLLDSLQINRDKAETVVSEVLAAEVALRELASLVHPTH
ncbi:aminoacyl-tRNA deacylase and HDOD domain-containing protein [Pseudomonas sp. M30-35]|uniref:aminoacyl-tRNA deacylase and HDOD domain-containing protein n=1 Tax=Pseudomonas sp. M30-35 TaxID=1981174 RepID=UPI000B3D14E3|nr:aminoacyl-tRNA deacylase and HDOD domain-containing protein [Pseudomonas sp. M30-35]ARU90415.1 histidine kinase [Pseudomonas sp. M30-35]